MQAHTSMQEMSGGGGGGEGDPIGKPSNRETFSGLKNKNKSSIAGISAWPSLTKAELFCQNLSMTITFNFI